MKKPTVEGVGINDSTYKVVTGKCPFYRAWQAMLRRCYSTVSQVKDSSYIGCSVDSKWHLFSTFRAWMITQDWEGKQLDKDILIPGNKVYGPNTCLFVSQAINSLLTTQEKIRGPYPLGVTTNRRGFKATVRKHNKNIHMGTYETPEEAHQVYLEKKSEWITELAGKETCPVTQNALLAAAKKLRDQLIS